VPKLPQVSGIRLVKVLRSLGYDVIRQRGSHVHLRKVTALGEHAVTIPEHKVLAKGTLNDIINRVSLWNSISKTDLINLLK